MDTELNNIIAQVYSYTCLVEQENTLLRAAIDQAIKVGGLILWPGEEVRSWCQGTDISLVPDLAEYLAQKENKND